MCRALPARAAAQTGGVMNRRRIFSGLLFALLAVSTPAFAQTAEPDALKVALDTVWVLFAAFLVFWMNAGFACLEAGLCRAKNAVNILAKNFVVFAVASIAFWIVGFAM